MLNIRCAHCQAMSFRGLTTCGRNLLTHTCHANGTLSHSIKAAATQNYNKRQGSPTTLSRVLHHHRTEGSSNLMRHLMQPGGRRAQQGWGGAAPARGGLACAGRCAQAGLRPAAHSAQAGRHTAVSGVPLVGDRSRTFPTQPHPVL